MPHEPQDEASRILTEIRELRDEMRQELVDLKRLMQATRNRIPLFSEILANQILLADGSGRNNVELLSRMGPERHTLKLFRTDAGKLCFRPPGPSTRHGRTVFLFSLQKSGTNYALEVLKQLGFEDTGCSCYQVNEMLDDRRFTPPGEVELHYLPYLAQKQLVLPGQFYTGHVLPEHVKSAHKRRETLFQVRDLRFVVMSCVRAHLAFSGNISRSSMPTEEEMFSFLAAGRIDFYLDMYAKMVSLADYCLVTRFEELAAAVEGHSNPTTRNIASLTGCPEDEVIRAVRKSSGRKTATYSGMNSRICGIWSKRIEDIFQAHKLDVANEELGYERTYKSQRIGGMTEGIAKKP